MNSKLSHAQYENTTISMGEKKCLPTSLNSENKDKPPKSEGRVAREFPHVQSEAF